MKKIVSAVAIAAMAAGFAAAEVKISANYRTGIEALTHTAGKSTKLMNLSTANRTTSDALSFKGSADFGGMELEIDPTLLAGATYSADKQNLVKKYNGWINFGNFMFKSGSWDSRTVGRVNADIGNHEGKFWGELNKPGLANKIGTNGLGSDISQQNGGGNKITAMAQYNFKDFGLQVRAGVIENNADKSETKYTYDNSKTNKDHIKSETTSKAADYNTEGENWNFAFDQYFAEVNYSVKDLGKFTVTSKNQAKDNAVGFFYEPASFVDGLTGLVGVVYEKTRGVTVNTDGDSLDAQTLGLELRVRYDLSKALDLPISVTGMMEYTGGDGAAYLDKGDLKFQTAANADPSKNKASNLESFNAVFGMLSVTYKMNETVQPFFSAIYTSGNKVATVTPMHKDQKYDASLRLYAGASIFNTASANIITGVYCDAPSFFSGNETTYSYAIPVLMRVKF